MTSTTSQVQCSLCNRQFVSGADGVLVRAVRNSLHVAFIAGCGWADCAAAAADFQAKVRADAERELAAYQRNLQARRQQRKSCAAKPRSVNCERDTQPRRLPYKDQDEEVGSELTVPGSGLTTNVGATVERALSQNDFVASGQADSQNAKLLEWFSRPAHFGKWFKSTQLEEMSGATRMNNRAVDLRPVFIERGHFIDNCMMTDEATQRKASYYRVCNIEDAVCLTAEQKTKILATEPVTGTRYR